MPNIIMTIMLRVPGRDETFTCRLVFLPLYLNLPCVAMANVLIVQGRCCRFYLLLFAVSAAVLPFARQQQAAASLCSTDLTGSGVPDKVFSTSPHAIPWAAGGLLGQLLGALQQQLQALQTCITC